jgi:hypothetical protein
MKKTFIGNMQAKFTLKPGLKIQDLHEDIATKYDANLVDKEDKVNGIILRNLIQSNQSDPTRPKWGIDGNRDVTLSLDSSDCFDKFIKQLKREHGTAAGSTTPRDKIYVYDPEDGSETWLDPQRTINNFRVLMIHGYDNAQFGMCVYGPYYVRRTSNATWPARMSIDDKNYVNKIREVLGWPTKLTNWDREIKKEDLIPPDTLGPDGKLLPKWGIKGDIMYQFLYGDTLRNAKKYDGEWSLQLKKLDIWSADIELRLIDSVIKNHIYDEGVRGDVPPPDGRPYEEQMGWIGKLDPIFPNFTGLLKEFPWVIDIIQ